MASKIRFVVEWQYGCYEGCSTYETSLSDSTTILAEERKSDYEVWDNMMFYIFEGNLGCDCYFSQAFDLPWTLPCGEEIFFKRVHLYRNGKYLGWNSQQPEIYGCQYLGDRSGMIWEAEGRELFDPDWTPY